MVPVPLVALVSMVVRVAQDIPPFLFLFMFPPLPKSRGEFVFICMWWILLLDFCIRLGIACRPVVKFAFGTMGVC